MTTLFAESVQRAGKLDVGLRQYGDESGPPVYLMHGFPYDVRCFDEVAPVLASHGCHVVVPYLRGYGPTRFTSPATIRSGEQAALGYDLLELMNALKTAPAIVAGFDWGGRAACVVAALWPDRVRGLVSGGGYNIQDIANANQPDSPQQELQYWYQYYFHSERGRAGLEKNRESLCRLLWELWSPQWRFSDASFAATAASFHNPDFVDVVIHSYRHRYGLVGGDPDMLSIEAKLARQTRIEVPTIALMGDDNGVLPSQADQAIARRFADSLEIRRLHGIGHNVAQEAPKEFAQAVLDLLAR